MENGNNKIKVEQEDSKKNTCEVVNADAFVLQLTSSIDLIRRGVDSADQRLIARALRICNVSRSNFKPKYILEVLKGFEKLLENQSKNEFEIMINCLKDTLNLPFFTGGDVLISNDQMNSNTYEEQKTNQLIERIDWNSIKICTKECLTFIGIMVFINLYNLKIKDNLFNVNKSSEFKKEHFSICIEFSRILFEFSRKYTQQSMDLLNSKIVYYYSRVHEICSEFANIKNDILESYRTAVLNHNTMLQAACINLVLRNYVLTNRCDLGLKALEKLTYPENLSSGIQQARYLYYCGRIYATQLKYRIAYNSLTQSLRKTPQTKGKNSLNFVLSAQKFAIVVQMLMGEVPDRCIFNTPELRKGLVPYLELVKAVRSGDMREFDLNLKKRNLIYKRDGTLSLIQRLAHNVIRSGLKTICSSYSRIYLEDIANYFGWDNSQDIEGVVSKAIFDNVVDAKINDDVKCLETNQKYEQYGSESMLNSLHSRIAFCLLLRSNAIKAMEYPQIIFSNNENNDDEEARRLSQEEIEAAVNSVDDAML